MYLLLSDLQDPWCLRVSALLEERNYSARIISNPLMYPSRFAWSLDNEQSTSQLIWDEESPVFDNQITGVLVRSTGWIDPAGWQPDNLAYMYAETQAALLAWFWSLACPVVNRYSAAIWYRPQVPLLSWQPLLQGCGLPTLETMVTNVEHEARSFGQRFTLDGANAAVYGPLSSATRYIVSDNKDWSSLADLQRIMPVCLTHPYGQVQFVCVVGDQVVWAGQPSSGFELFEPALRRFAIAAGLSFVELAFASLFQRTRIIAVDPYPHFDHFDNVSRQQIVEGIVSLLTEEAGHTGQGSAQMMQRSFL